MSKAGDKMCNKGGLSITGTTKPDPTHEIVEVSKAGSQLRIPSPVRGGWLPGIEKAQGLRGCNFVLERRALFMSKTDDKGRHAFVFGTGSVVPVCFDAV